MIDKHLPKLGKDAYDTLWPTHPRDTKSPLSSDILVHSLCSADSQLLPFQPLFKYPSSKVSHTFPELLARHPVPPHTKNTGKFVPTQMLQSCSRPYYYMHLFTSFLFPLNGTFEGWGLLNVSIAFSHSQSFIRALCPSFGGYNDEDSVPSFKELRLHWGRKIIRVQCVKCSQRTAQGTTELGGRGEGKGGILELGSGGGGLLRG